MGIPLLFNNDTNNNVNDMLDMYFEESNVD